MLNHELKLKVSIPVILLINIDHFAVLCNGTRLVITRHGNHFMEAKVILESNARYKVFIPRMTLSSLDPRLPFKFQRNNTCLMKVKWN